MIHIALQATAHTPEELANALDALAREIRFNGVHDNQLQGTGCSWILQSKGYPTPGFPSRPPGSSLNPIYRTIQEGKLETLPTPPALADFYRNNVCRELPATKAQQTEYTVNLRYPAEKGLPPYNRYSLTTTWEEAIMDIVNECQQNSNLQPNDVVTVTAYLSETPLAERSEPVRVQITTGRPKILCGLEDHS